MAPGCVKEEYYERQDVKGKVNGMGGGRDKLLMPFLFLFYPLEEDEPSCGTRSHT